MLPSTGYFKAINCPFYESGTCDRPYCHFKHSKRDVGITTEAIESVQNRSTGQVEESKPATMVTSNSDVLQQLVTEAVKKVLANRNVTDVDNKFSCQNVVSQVVEGLKPTLTSGSSGTIDNVTANMVEKRADTPAPVNTSLPCVYNPTPIAELKKRHIPIVSYMPTRKSSVAVKRKCSPDRVKPWLNISSESMEPSTVEIKYKPTIIINPEARDTMQSYIPTCKSDSASINSYKDGSSNEYLSKLRETYYPKCKKKREEYVPKKVKTPLKTTDGLNESVLDHFETDFDMMDEVLTCTKSTSDIRSSEVSQDSSVDLEPKFSDDEEDNSNNCNNTDGYSHDGKKVNITNIDSMTLEQNESYCDAETSDCSNNIHTVGTHVQKVVDSNELHVTEEQQNEKISVCINIRKQKRLSSEEGSKTVPCEKASTLQIDSHKSTIGDVKEHKSRDKNKSKSQKDHSMSHKRYKDKHDSNKKSHSTSSSKSKSKTKNYSRHKSKECRDKKYDKDKNKGKHQEKYGEKEKDREGRENKLKSKSDRRDHHGSGKRHRYYSKSSSRKQEHIKNKNDKCSKTENKSDDKVIEKSHARMGYKEERNSTDRSINSLESIRLSPVDDGEEENDDRQSSIIDNDIDVIFSTSDSDHDVQEECLKIFQEYQLPERSKATESPKESSTLLEKEKEQTEEVGRKRVAHPSAATCVTRQIGITQQARKLVNPQQKMYERWRLMRDAAIEKTISASSSVSKDVRRNHTEVIGTASNSELSLNGNGRVRIAHVPYAKSLAIEKKKVTENAGKAVEPKTTDNYKTAAQTAKSGVRVAHVPQVVPQLIRPEPLQVTTQKFPLNVRQYYVNMMHDVCVLIYTNAEDAAQRAVKEEHACHERCKALTVYKNSCMLAAHRLRKEIDQNSSGDNNTTTMPGSSMVSHEAVLTGKAKGSWSVLKTKKSITKFRGTALYGMLKKWIMTEQQLRDNGFPRSHPDGHKGRAKVYVINSRNQSILSKVPNERVCSRCGQTYMIDRQGFALQPQNCIYHWGRKFTIKGEGKYSCCQQYGSATGCCDAKTHVWDYTDYENLRGYVKTLPKDTPIEEQGVYALDCEMCYTTQGLELTRITVIDEDCSVVYETLVNPQNPIIDYNTRFSGITEEDMKDVTTTLLDVQATLLTMFSEKTILVGHSLESDFKALKLLHDTVVDTSVMFPHKNGYPQKRALKNLCSEYLRKLIQNDVGGHDSKEDAIACMELILWKAKEEAKLQ
ncbi:PREDICTED: RNA exonuclease 1 homolog isoform X2 [Eufriesea mexicana]|uniref:RNA exonuclease 1 homolog isoform X2 n=1 Tax=Eufriesea mexicana TaxID=516756 RepID=UPI00083C7BE3|nr:PREDICTED: RNA exonuclease 1 homolog isoform X2 [Eufriesea mexicana]